MYTWRYDKVLGTLYIASRHPREKHQRAKEKQGKTYFCQFVNEGEKGQKKTVEGNGLLVTATDWQMLMDLKQKLQFPPQIAVTNQRPDIVIWSASTKQAILLELTVPWEERIEDAYERKRLKYQDLLAECRDNGWRVWLFPVEVGSREFVGQSMWRAWRALGIVGGERSKLIGNLCKEAETASMWLWRKRLRDPNRPMKIDEKLTEMFDNVWTDSMEALEDLGLGEEECVKILLHFLTVIALFLIVD
ncbi:Hypothetical predicted protein [Mytilus galloprovincialis]|uniref:Uncharacterized protein n=1 Tax=Mytilus galloprovincialis TaxID=29158 RepID=A0A8B6DBV0_MYTGA|nr:Hypothetical predicted protein [Mytilus galloprovincialis]